MQAYTLSKQNMMGKVFSGLFMSLLTAFVGMIAGQYVPSVFIGILAIAEIVMIFVGMMMQRRRSIGMGFVLVFTFISGITIYPSISYYASTLGAGVVLQAVAVSAVAFGIAAVVASRTSLDFSFLGGFLFIGLMAILVMGVVSFFIGFSTVTQLIYSILGIAIFIGYVLFDVNRIAHRGVAEGQVPWVVLSLYLDFINLFLFVLQLMGVLNSSSRR